MMNDDEETVNLDPIIVKPSRGERLKKSIAARLRRKETKKVKHTHSFKEEKDAKERLRARRILEAQKKKSRTT